MLFTRRVYARNLKNIFNFLDDQISPNLFYLQQNSIVIFGADVQHNFGAGISDSPQN